jgi:hypothetical protein
MTRYFLVDDTHRAFEMEISPTEYEALWRASETEQSGRATEADALICSVTDSDEVRCVMYRRGGVWTSIPEAFESMTIRLTE